jgi:hypothetical protein
MKAATKHKRHWYQFSLRALLVLMTAVSITVGYVGHIARWAHDRELFVQTTEDFTMVGYIDPPGPGDKWPWQLWLLNHVGVEYCAPVQRFIFLAKDKDKIARARSLFPEADVMIQ